MKRNQIKAAARVLETMGLRVTGTRHYAGNDYALDYVDPINGVTGHTAETAKQINTRETDEADARRTAEYHYPYTS